MILKIAVESEEPIYRQLERQLIAGIATGELAPGTGLSSVRQLACDLGINLHTVAKAYQHLRQEGYLTNNRQKGMTVAAQMPEADEAFRARAIEGLTAPIAEMVCRGLDRDACLDAAAQAYDALLAQK